MIGIYRTQEEVDAWAKRCPVETFKRRHPRGLRHRHRARTRRDRRRASNEAVEAAIDFARRSPEPEPSTYRLHVFAEPLNPPAALARAAVGAADGRRRAGSTRCATASPRRCGATGTSSISAKAPASAAARSRTPRISIRSSVADRMVDTPISELGFTGAALGASATGVRCIADLMFADFLFEAAGQIVLQAAKLRYMSNGQMQAPMVIRVGAGAVRSAGPHHSGTYHPVWAPHPRPHRLPAVDAGRCQGADEDGPSRPRSRHHARDQSPVRVERAGAGRRASRPVRRRTDRADRGRTLTIASAGQLVARALEAAEILAKEGIEVEVIDLRTIQPLDVETVAESVRRTHRLLVVDEAYAMFGVGAELGAGHERVLLRRPGWACRAAAHGARQSSVRAFLGAGDARLDGGDRRTGAARHARPSPIRSRERGRPLVPERRARRLR